MNVKRILCLLLALATLLPAWAQRPGTGKILATGRIVDSEGNPVYGFIASDYVIDQNIY